jgi:hypothetical protein
MWTTNTFFFWPTLSVVPFAYLGLPLGTTRPSVHDMTPIVNQIDRYLNACARFLDYSGRLQLVNCVLSSLPNHYLSSRRSSKLLITREDTVCGPNKKTRAAPRSSLSSLWSLLYISLTYPTHARRYQGRTRWLCLGSHPWHSQRLHCLSALTATFLIHLLWLK